MERVRSTSLEKSAWPGVSIKLTLTSPTRMAAFLAKTVIPRSRSSSLLSMIKVPAASASRKVLLCLSRPSTRVVLPWSTWAMTAMLRRVARGRGPLGAGVPGAARDGAAVMGITYNVTTVGCAGPRTPGRCAGFALA